MCAVSGHRPGLSCTRQKHAVPDRPRAKAVSAPRSSSWVKMFRFDGFVTSYPPAEGSVSRDSLTKPFRFNSTPVLKRQVIGGHRHPPPPPPPPLQGAAGSGGDAAEPGLHPAPSECRPVAPGGGRGGGSCVRVSSRGVLGLPRLGLPVCSSPGSPGGPPAPPSCALRGAPCPMCLAGRGDPCPMCLAGGPVLQAPCGGPRAPCGVPALSAVSI